MICIQLTPSRARFLAGLTNAASKDPQRPVLQCVGMEWSGLLGSDPEVTFVATDSYLMAYRTLTDREAIGVDNTEQTQADATKAKGSLMISAKELGKALKEAARIADKDGVVGEKVALCGPIEGRYLAISTHPLGKSYVHVPLENYQFPNWRTLVPPDNHREEYDGKLPALIPDRLRQVLSTITSETRLGEIPIRFSFQSELKPVSFWRKATADDGFEWEALLMPVRV